MTKLDYFLEAHFIKVAKRPQRKFEETLTTFDRDIFWYDRNEVDRQKEYKQRTNTPTKKVTYADHRRVIETAATIMRKNTQHAIAMCILTHRAFSDYRNKFFEGNGSFYKDYGYLLRKVAMLFNPHKSMLLKSNISSKLRDFQKPTLVQVNYITGTIEKVTPPSNKFTLAEWAFRYNEAAVESTQYMVAGIKVGV